MEFPCLGFPLQHVYCGVPKQWNWQEDPASKKLATKMDDLSLILGTWDAYGGRRELAPSTCPLTSTYGMRHECHTRNK